MKVILISGLEIKTNKPVQYFAKDCERLRRYLLKKVGLKKKDIYFFDPKCILRIKPRGLLNKIKWIISKNSNEPLLVYYSGHGLSKMWSLYELNDRRVKSYSLHFNALTKAVKDHNSALIVVANTCFAMSLKHYLKKLRYPWQLIGLAPEGRYGESDGVLGQIIKSWTRHYKANPKFNTGKRFVRCFSVKRYDQTKYGFRYGDDGCLHKFFFSYSIKRIKAVLCAGLHFDHLLYPKK